MSSLTNPIAEEAFVGGLIGPQHRLDEVEGDPIEPEAITTPALRDLYEAILRLYPRVPPTPTNLAPLTVLPKDELERLALEFAGTPVGFHASIVRDYEAQRRLHSAVGKAEQILRSGRGNATERYEEVMAIMEAARPALGEQGIRSFEQSVDEFLDVIDARRNDVSRAITLPPGFNLGHYVDRLKPGWLITMSARTGYGKSIMGEMLAEHAFFEGHRVLYMHLENMPEEVWDRRCVRWSQGSVTMDDLRDGRVNGDQIANQMRAAAARVKAKYDNWLRYVHARGWSWLRIVSAIRASKPDVVIIDYIQKINLYAGFPSQMPEWRRYELTLDSLKETAEIETHPCAIIVFSQEDAEGNTKATKTLADKVQLHVRLLREQLDEDRVIGNEVFHEGELDPVGHLQVVKHNSGRTGFAPVFVRGQSFTIFPAVLGTHFSEDQPASGKPRENKRRWRGVGPHVNPFTGR